MLPFTNQLLKQDLRQTFVLAWVLTTLLDSQLLHLEYKESVTSNLRRLKKYFLRH